MGEGARNGLIGVAIFAAVGIAVWWALIRRPSETDYARQIELSEVETTADNNREVRVGGWMRNKAGERLADVALGARCPGVGDVVVGAGPLGPREMRRFSVLAGTTEGLPGFQVANVDYRLVTDCSVRVVGVRYATGDEPEPAPRPTTPGPSERGI